MKDERGDLVEGEVSSFESCCDRGGECGLSVGDDGF
jgi:hypothetical protein